MAVRDRVLALTAAVVVLAGCGGSGGQDTGTADVPTGSSSAASVSPGATADPGRPAPLVIDVTIEGGEVRPSNAVLQAAVGLRFVFRVDSDSTDELHVHSTPEHTFDVGVGPAQSFEFTVDIPGRVDVELHELPRTIATIQVR